MNSSETARSFLYGIHGNNIDVIQFLSSEKNVPEFVTDEQDTEFTYAIRFSDVETIEWIWTNRTHQRLTAAGSLGQPAHWHAYKRDPSKDGELSKMEPEAFQKLTDTF